MKIAGFEVTYLSSWDGLPVKNHLPPELCARMKTENQWLEEGYILKEDATTYEMHPSALAKRLFTYYLDTDTEKVMRSNAPKNCMTCSIRRGRFCDIAGDYVSSKNGCSEWTFAETK